MHRIELSNPDVSRGRSGPGGVTITELAGLLGTTVRALRYYEGAGLLRPDRTSGNVRRYGADARMTARLLVALRQAGVPLQRLRDAIADGERPSEAMLFQILESRLRAAKNHVLEVEQLIGQARSGAFTAWSTLTLYADPPSPVAEDRP